MKKAIVPTAKDVNEAHRLARSAAETAVEHAIRCGKMLAQKKASIPHGKFEEWVIQSCEFSSRTARLYMKAAEQNGNGLPFSSLKSLFHQESEKSEPPKPAPTPEPRTDASAPQAPSSHQSGATVESAGASHAASAQPEASLVDSEPELPSADEMRLEQEAIDREYAASISKVMESDNRLTAADVELHRQAAEIAALKQSRDGFMRAKDEYVRLVKARDRTIEQLERKLRQAQEENERLKERVAIMEAA